MIQARCERREKGGRKQDRGTMQRSKEVARDMGGRQNSSTEIRKRLGMVEPKEQMKRSEKAGEVARQTEATEYEKEYLKKLRLTVRIHTERNTTNLNRKEEEAGQ